MDVLLLFPLLLFCRWGQIVVVLASESLLSRVSVRCFESVLENETRKTHQVVVCELFDVTRLDTQILECLGLGINNLIHELTLHQVGRESVPPEHLVQDSGDGLHESLGDIDMSPLLEDFYVHHGGNLGHSILLGAIELKGLADSRLVVEDLLKGSTNIDRL